MNDDLAYQIARLTAKIVRKEADLMELEAEVLDLRRDVEAFQARYNRVVKPVEIRLEAAQDAIRELTDRQRYGVGMAALGDANPLPSTWEPPPDYVPVEEQFRRAWQVPPQQARVAPESPTSAAPKPRAEAVDSREARVKKLYRTLARRYHPDLAADPGERDHRNALMARINEAYAERDLDLLQTLASSPEDAPPNEPLDALRLEELRRIDAQLDSRLAELAFERTNLLHNDQARLVMEEKIARRQGRDLLAQMAADLERDYQAAMTQLEQLRRR